MQLHEVIGLSSQLLQGVLEWFERVPQPMGTALLVVCAIGLFQAWGHSNSVSASR